MEKPSRGGLYKIDVLQNNMRLVLQYFMNGEQFYLI